LSTRETVIADTPATSATSRMVTFFIKNAPILVRNYGKVRQAHRRENRRAAVRRCGIACGEMKSVSVLWHDTTLR
jgi:hypothetical protein